MNFFETGVLSKDVKSPIKSKDMADVVNYKNWLRFLADNSKKAKTKENIKCTN